MQQWIARAALSTFAWLLSRGAYRAATANARCLPWISPNQAHRLFALIGRSRRLGQPHVAAALFASHVRSLGSAPWPEATNRFLLGVNTPQLAKTLQAAVAPGVRRGEAPALAVHACLDIAAGADAADRLKTLSLLERLEPRLLQEPPVQAALAALPHFVSQTALVPSVSQHAMNRAGKGGLVIVPSATLTFPDIEALLGGGHPVDIIPYRPNPATSTRWRSDIAASGSASPPGYVDAVEEGSDLNSAEHLALSQAADEIAGRALRDPGISPAMALDAFFARHGEAAELALSDRIFSWLRTHHAFTRALKDRPLSGVLMVEPTDEVRTCVAGALRTAGRADDLMIMRNARQLSTLTEMRGGDPTPQALWVDTDDFAGILAAPPVPTLDRAEGVFAHARGRLYAPAADALVEAFDTPPVSLNSVLESSFRLARFSAAVPAQAAAAWISPAAGLRVAALLQLQAADVQARVGAIAQLFVSTQLPQLMLTDRRSREAIRMVGPRYGIVMPTRVPQLRILSRNLADAGAAVHEPQVVYMSDMPRYRRPLANRFHALDTYSARQMTDHFGLAPSTVRVAGSLRATPAQLAPIRKTESARIRVTLASQPEPADRALERVQALLEALPKIGGTWSLALRPHPSDSADRIDLYRRAAAAAEIEMTLGGALNETDILVTGFSNLVLEASVADLRTVVYWTASTAPPIPYAEMGLALKADSAVELTRLLEACARNAPEALALDETRRLYIAENPLLASGSAKTTAGDILRSARNGRRV